MNELLVISLRESRREQHKSKTSLDEPSGIYDNPGDTKWIKHIIQWDQECIKKLRQTSNFQVKDRRYKGKNEQELITKGKILRNIENHHGENS